jgi:hypothetical protein
MKWLLLAVGGLILNGAGLSLLGDAVLRKGREPESWLWFYEGTLALVLVNAGICCVVEASLVKHSGRS